MKCLSIKHEIHFNELLLTKWTQSGGNEIIPKSFYIFKEYSVKRNLRTFTCWFWLIWRVLLLLFNILKLLQKIHFPLEVFLILFINTEGLIFYSIKIFLLQYYINWPNVITRLSLLTKLFSKRYFMFRYLMTSWNLRFENFQILI